MSYMVTTSTQKRNSGRFRFGQSFDYTAIEFMRRRNPHANYLCEGIVKEAFDKGISFVKPGTEEKTSWSDAMVKALEPHWSDIINSIVFERAFGKSLLMAIKDNDFATMQLRAFDPSYYDISYNKDGSILNIEAREFVGGINADQYTHRLGKFGKGVKSKKLEYAHELIIREGKTKGTGISILESVWDTIFGLMMIDEHSVYFVIRVGGGLKVMRVPEDKYNDTDYMSKLNAQLEDINSGNGIITIPSVVLGDGRMTDDMSFDLQSGDQINMEQFRDVLLGSLSIATGIPREAWLGNEIGQRSAEITASKKFEIMQNIQSNYEQSVKFSCDMINEYEAISGYTEDYDIKHNVREELTELARMELLKLKMDIVNASGFKLSQSDIEDMTGLTLEEKEIDPLGIQGEDGEITSKTEGESEETEVVKTEESEQE